MPYNAWLTPNAPTAAFTCRRLLIPGGEDWLAIVTGALNELIYPRNFELFGAYTPDQTAELFMDMFNDFCFNVDPGCRVIGEIVTLTYSPAPAANWLPCDGRSLVRADYADLFTLIGTTFGSVDSTHFNIPDIQGRTIVGTGTGTGLTPRAEGDSFGEETHTLTTGEMPSHTHTTGNSALLGTSAPPPLDALGPNPLPAFTGSAGGDGPHNNMQPSLALSYYIVVF